MIVLEISLIFLETESKGEAARVAGEKELRHLPRYQVRLLPMLVYGPWEAAVLG